MKSEPYRDYPFVRKDYFSSTNEENENPNIQPSALSERSFVVKTFFAVSEDAVAGAFAGLVGRTLTAPFDVIKIRYQLLCRDVTVSSSMIQAFRTVVKEEGILALWKGNLSATYLWISYALIQFGTYGMIKHWDESPAASLSDNLQVSSSKKPVSGNMNHAFLAGAVAGMKTLTFLHPFIFSLNRNSSNGNHVSI
jgi:solute carrier family 25 thiamine pyrophosphate transporter 19